MEEPARRLDVQGLRAIAVLLVIAFHAGLPVPGGYVGVDVFFVISGFVITGLLLREQGRTGRISLATFYRRRARRLLPALALMLTVTLLASALLQSPISETGGQLLTAKTAAGAALFVANVVLYRVPVDGYFAARAGDNTLLHTWSLSVEEQFYVLFPALIIAVCAYVSLPRRRGALVGMVSVVAAVSFGLSVLLSFGELTIPGVASPESFAFYLPFSRAWEFAVGALVALGVNRLSRLGSASRRLAAYAGAVGLVASAVILSEGIAPFPGWVAAVPVVSAALLIVGGTRQQDGSSTLVTWALASPPLAFIGDRSYSLYLWHWPCIVFATILLPADSSAPLVGAIVSFPLALAAYQLVESPLRRRHSITVRAIVVPSVLLPLVLAIGLGLQTRVSWGQGDMVALQKSLVTPTIGVRAGCFEGGVIGRDVFERCRFEADGVSRGTILLVGDSHADSIADGVLAASHELGYDVVEIAAGGCAYIGETVELETSVTNCFELSRWRTEYAVDQRVDLVITAQASEEHAEDPEGWLAGNLEVLGQLHEAGVPTLYVGDVPHIGVNGSPCWYGTLLATCEVGRDLVLRRQGAGLAVEREIVEGVPGLVYWSPFDNFCGPVECSARVGDLMLYRDAEHLNAHGSLSLAGDLRRQIESAMTGKAPAS